MNRKISKYISRGGCVYPLVPHPHKDYQAIIVIPVKDEEEFLPDTLESIRQNKNELLKQTLVVLVVNNPPGWTESQRKQNIRILENYSGKSHKYRDILNISCIDRTSPGLENNPACGVGEARKTGFDSTLEILENPGNAIFISLDADTLVEENYLEAIFDFFALSPNAAGATVDFKHMPGESEEHTRAIELYETYMRYFKTGLQVAASPYAYHSLGSAIVCRAEAYLRAGGMKKKSAGEDFYFLQDLKKTGFLGNITETSVHPSARPSTRVPFGTGPAVRDIMGGNELKFNNPAAFQALAGLLRKVNDAHYEQLDGDFIKYLRAGCIPPVCDFLLSAGFGDAWQKIVENTPERRESLLNAFHTWFDAFRTLKLIHFLENNHPSDFARSGWRSAFFALVKAFDISCQLPEDASCQMILDFLRSADDKLNAVF